MIRTAVRRGLRRRCPQCGKGRLFQGWSALRPTCEVCGLPLAAREGDLWAPMYASMAAITGVFIIVMLWVVHPAPENVVLGRVILVAAAFAAMWGSLPFRKGVAVALDYIRELRLNNYAGHVMREDDPEPPRAAESPRA
jgi:uncharacterized protein (DUF983 family)